MYRLTLNLIAVLFAWVWLAGCGEQPAGPSESSPSAPEASLDESVAVEPIVTVCLLPKKKGLPYFSSCADGAREAAAELGNVELIYDGPTDGSPEKSAALIEQWTLKGVDVIAVSPNDPDVVAPAMRKAREAGIHVLTWDADAATDTRDFMVNQATPRDIGYALVDAMAADLGGDQAQGKLAILTATLTAANQNAWIAEMKNRLAKYPGLELVAVKPTLEDQKLAFQVAQDLMKAYPDLKGMFGISSVAFPGGAEAIRQAGKSGEVLITGLSTPNNMREYVKDGTVRSVILWNTVDLGYLTVHAAEALAAGKLAPGDTQLTAGRLGERKIEGDNILLGELLVFTVDNINQYNF